MTAPNRQQRLASLHNRIASPQDAYERCRVYPCANRTTADKGEGLNRLYCRQHIEHYRRHGSYVKSSYRSQELWPYRQTALRWLQSRNDLPLVRRAIASVRGLYASAGAPVEAFRLAGRPPRDRARAIWARLRAKEVHPVLVVAAWLAVLLRLEDDPQPDRHEEYRRVQAAKLLHRMAGGTHKRWERALPDGTVESTELHKHPVSRGRVLRVLGDSLAAACDGLEAETVTGSQWGQQFSAVQPQRDKQPDSPD